MPETWSIISQVPGHRSFKHRMQTILIVNKTNSRDQSGTLSARQKHNCGVLNMIAAAESIRGVKLIDLL
jgi:hypothetical protein